MKFIKKNPTIESEENLLSQLQAYGKASKLFTNNFVLKIDNKKLEDMLTKTKKVILPKPLDKRITYKVILEGFNTEKDLTLELPDDTNITIYNVKARKLKVSGGEQININYKEENTIEKLEIENSKDLFLELPQQIKLPQISIKNTDSIRLRSEWTIDFENANINANTLNLQNIGQNINFENSNLQLKDLISNNKTLNFTNCQGHINSLNNTQNITQTKTDIILEDSTMEINSLIVNTIWLINSEIQNTQEPTIIKCSTFFLDKSKITASSLELDAFNSFQSEKSVLDTQDFILNTSKFIASQTEFFNNCKVLIINLISQKHKIYTKVLQLEGKEKIEEYLLRQELFLSLSKSYQNCLDDIKQNIENFTKHQYIEPIKEIKRTRK